MVEHTAGGLLIESANSAFHPSSVFEIPISQGYS